MIFDLNKTELPSDQQGYDVCVAGGGVAGIVTATRLAALGFHVVLLEGGGEEFSDESQQLYQGANVGRSYFDLDSARLRYLGGSSNHWGGLCRALDTHDFQKRPYIPYSGWPFTISELDPYLAAASRILEISSKYNDTELEGSRGGFNLIEFHQSPPVYFREKYKDDLQSNERLDLFLNSNLVNIEIDAGTGYVDGFTCANFVNPDFRHKFSAKAYILALGGIENPRMLLNCRDTFSTGIGNNNDLVGRYFMEHFHVHAGYYVANTTSWPFGEELVYLSPSIKLMDSQRIANAGLRISPINQERSLFIVTKDTARRILCTNDIIRDFAQSIQKFRCPVDPFPVDNAGFLRVASEQVPNRNSRVLLTEETDRFGLRQIALDWQANEIDRRTIKVMLTTFGRYLSSRGFGHVKLVEWLIDDNHPIPTVYEDRWIGAGAHHMGTTRMGTTAEEGVVDADCKVFGVHNLFIAGSSVFPTGGHANPTLTIVQLALRLCDHIHRVLVDKL